MWANSSKQFLKSHWALVYIAYFTEFILQICDYAQKRRIDTKIVNTRLTKIFIAIFAPDERLPSSATLLCAPMTHCGGVNIFISNQSLDLSCIFSKSESEGLIDITEWTSKKLSFDSKVTKIKLKSRSEKIKNSNLAHWIEASTRCILFSGTLWKSWLLLASVGGSISANSGRQI